MKENKGNLHLIKIPVRNSCFVMHLLDAFSYLYDPCDSIQADFDVYDGMHELEEVSFVIHNHDKFCLCDSFPKNSTYEFSMKFFCGT
jgi:hypothetical protein